VKQTPILITGSHRSGTTWVGKMLSLTDEVQYIYECFHPNGILRSKGIFDIWYKYLTNEEGHYINNLDRIFKYHYSFSEAYNPFDRNRKFNLRNTPVRLEFYRACKRIHNSDPSPTPLLKDPIALFSVSWLVKHFHIRPLILIRHPAAFVSSLLRLNWRFNFENFLNQKKLMNQYLSSFEDEMKKTYKNDAVKEGALLWNCLHHVINEYKKSYQNWLFKRHEDLSINPIDEFKTIYNFFGLVFTSEIEKEIKNHTSVINNSDVKIKGQIHQLQRDSIANIKNWKKRLSDQQITVIRDMTEEISSHFYSDDDW